MVQRRELFGGALRCAGLVCGAIAVQAHADFLPHVPDAGPGAGNYTLAAVNDSSGASILFAYDFLRGAAFPEPTNYAGPGGTITAYAGPTVMGARVTPGEPGVWGYAIGVVFQAFVVDHPTQVLVEWDLTAAAPDFAWVYLTHAYPLPLTIAGDVSDVYRNGFYVDSGAGAMTFTLTPGIIYHFFGRANTWFFTGLGDVHLRISIIPAPGALPLFGLAAFSRRRRAP